MISIIENSPKIRYNNMIFGQFIEHFHTQIYVGIYDPSSRFADEDGFRTDVIDALKEIKCPIVRWPGGCFVSTYHWLDGVGAERTPVYDKSWQVEDPNTFGTDEYIKWCRKVDTEPYICTNAGTGTPEEMSDWVEYCNLSIGKYGRMRMANGHKEPYGVKYWSVGNENYGNWELGAKTVKDWGPLVCESAKLIRSVTKDAKLFAAGRADRNWTLPLLQAAGRHLDYISLHGYYDPRPLFHVNTPSPYMDCMMQTVSQLAEQLPTLSVLQLPFLYTDAPQMWRVLDGEIGDGFLSSLGAMDLVGLSWFDAGVRSFYTREKVETLADLVGLTLRVQESDLMSEMIQDLGAQPVQVVYSRVYAALHNAEIDGAENNWPSYEAMGHYEVAPYFLEDEHTRVPELQLASEAAMEKLAKLDESFPDIVRTCGKESALTERRLWAEREASAEAHMRAWGVEVTTLSAAEKARFRAAVEPLYARFGEQSGLLQRIRES